ncbi:MAG: hypothetical protein IKW39_02420, partial [Alphaproteobacteria bacterium]|nr:hypothetical protein [Alphaproteobacteria bacterium]
MDNKEVLVKELKEDTNNTFTYIKENINSFKYYLSPLYAKRQIGKLRRKQQNTLKSPNKNIRKKIENFKREYQKSQKLNHTEQVSASLNEAPSSINNFSVRQKLELIKKEYKQLKLRDLGYYVS